MRGMRGDPRVRRWVAARIGQGMNRTQIVAASKAGTDGWPLADKSLSNGTYDVIAGYLEGAKGEPLEAPTQKPARRSSKRIRELRARQDATHGEHRSKIVKLQLDLQKATNILELTDVESVFFDQKGVMGDTMSRLHEDLADLATWLDYVFEYVRAHMDDKGKLETIRHLRNRTVENGASPSEERTAQMLADRLEAKLHAKLMRGAEPEPKPKADDDPERGDRLDDAA